MIDETFDFADYKILRKLSQNFVNVFFGETRIKTKWKPPKSIILKEYIHLDDEDYTYNAQYENEIKILKMCDHPNIIKMIEYFNIIYKNDIYIYVVIEDGGVDLREFINITKIDNNLLCNLTHQITSGLVYLHANKIIHRDIKPHNIVIDGKYNARIIDFNISKIISEDHENIKTIFTKQMQSLWYRAPEMLFDFEYDYAIDIWSLGCIIVEMISGKALFKGENEMDQIYKICKFLGTPTTETWQDCDKFKYYSQIPKFANYELRKYLMKFDINIINLIEKMFIYAPDKRITAAEIMKFFEKL